MSEGTCPDEVTGEFRAVRAEAAGTPTAFSHRWGGLPSARWRPLQGIGTAIAAGAEADGWTADDLSVTCWLHK